MNYKKIASINAVRKTMVKISKEMLKHLTRLEIHHLIWSQKNYIYMKIKRPFEICRLCYLNLDKECDKL